MKFNPLNKLKNNNLILIKISIFNINSEIKSHYLINTIN
jgi:hypothetical protein